MEATNQSVVSSQVLSIFSEIFEGQSVRVYGSYENPLFVASDVGTAMGVKKTRKTVSKYLDGLEFQRASNGGPCDLHSQTILLTESGLYRFIYGSRTETGVKFREFVATLLHKLRTRQLELVSSKVKEHEQTIYEQATQILSLTKTGMIYRVYSENDQRYYIGSTIQPLAKRLSQHKSIIRSGKGTGSFTLWCMDVGLRNIRAELLEVVQFTDKRQLLAAEQAIIDNTPKILRLNDHAAICRTEDPHHRMSDIQTSSSGM